jgi:hypothetical protein
MEFRRSEHSSRRSNSTASAVPFNGSSTMIASALWGTVPSGWTVDGPGRLAANASFSYNGLWNSMMLSIVGDGSATPSTSWT